MSLDQPWLAMGCIPALDAVAFGEWNGQLLPWIVAIPLPRAHDVVLKLVLAVLLVSCIIIPTELELSHGIRTESQTAKRPSTKR